jgi:hypothetical protein
MRVNQASIFGVYKRVGYIFAIMLRVLHSSAIVTFHRFIQMRAYFAGFLIVR